MTESENENEVPGELSTERGTSEAHVEENGSTSGNLSKILHTDLRRQLAEVSTEPRKEEPLTLDELVKNYVRTMHIPPVIDWRELSDSEGEEDVLEHEEVDTSKFKAEADSIDHESLAKETVELESLDEWEILLKEKAAASASSKPADNKFKSCLLDVKSYGTLFHEPYKEMEMRMEEQCMGCRDFGELGRCVCCGGASVISPSCHLRKDHVKLRLVKEARVYRLMEMGQEFSETDLLECKSSDRGLVNICPSSHSSEN
uniref:Putative Na(+)-translocating NADH-quinone reductase subunit C n=1 Tax=Lygus hesperus TaxID=30085 RepID=A0A0A9W1U6_LYGHE